MGGAATDAHFEVALKSKKVFLTICLRNLYIDVVEIFTECLHIKRYFTYFTIVYIFIKVKLDKRIIRKAKVDTDSNNNPNDPQSCWKVGSYLPMAGSLQCSMHWFPHV